MAASTVTSLPYGYKVTGGIDLTTVLTNSAIRVEHFVYVPATTGNYLTFIGGKESNVLSNGDVEAWSAGAAAAPDSWALSGAGAAVAREAIIVQTGTYSAKVTRGGADCYLEQTVPLSVAAGHTLELRVWAYASVAARVKATIVDNAGTQDTGVHTGGSSFELLTAKRQVAAAATSCSIKLQVITGDTDGYFDGIVLLADNQVVFRMLGGTAAYPVFDYVDGMQFDGLKVIANEATDELYIHC
jgi:hypothetical protein